VQQTALRAAQLSQEWLDAKLKGAHEPCSDIFACLLPLKAETFWLCALKHM